MYIAYYIACIASPDAIDATCYRTFKISIVSSCRTIRALVCEYCCIACQGRALRSVGLVRFSCSCGPVWLRMRINHLSSVNTHSDSDHSYYMTPLPLLNIYARASPDPTSMPHGTHGNTSLTLAHTQTTLYTTSK